MDGTWTCPDGSSDSISICACTNNCKTAYLFTPPTTVISINEEKLAINCNEVIIANRTSNNSVDTHCYFPSKSLYVLKQEIHTVVDPRGVGRGGHASSRP